MINFRKLFETVYEPRSGDEKNFKDKHVIMKIKTPYDTESQFTSDKPKAKRKADYDEGDDVSVYEAADVHTKRADKEPVIVQAIDPKTGQSRAKTVMRRAGEIKIEEVEQIDELSDDKLRDYHAKAGADRKKAKAEVEKGMTAKKFTPASVQKTTDAYKRFVKRGKGMTLAANKMSEEVELEEGTVGHGKYTITTGAKMSGMGEGGPSHVVAKRAKMSKLGVPHHDEPGEYGHTVKVTVKNNETGETTHHHVYQRDTDRGSKEAIVSTRTVGTPRAKQKEHEKVIHNYLSGKKVSSLKEESVVVDELGEKVVNPYAVGMAAAMKATGDRPPLKKSTIIKGHEIAKSIKKEAMDPVGKEDSDIDNDGDVDKSDKYLKNRRKAIGRALQKEDASIDQENSSYSIYKKSNKPNPIKKNAEDAVKEEVDLDEAVEVRHDRYMRSHGKKARDSGHGSGQWMFTHKSMGDVDYNNSKEVHTARGSFSDAKKSAQKWAKEHGHHSVYVMEEVGQLDELSPNTLHGYIKKAVDNKGMHDRTVGRTSDRDSRRKSDNRLKGIVSASGRLADKANSDRYEEVEMIDELSKKTLGSYIKKSSEKVAYKSNHAGEIEGRGDSNITPAARSTLAKLNRKTVNGLVGISRATNRLTKEEAEQIDEAFKVGSMKLHDGSAVTLTKESVEALNSLFTQLNGANKAKMEERMMSGKKGFQEILSFAENI